MTPVLYIMPSSHETEHVCLNVIYCSDLGAHIDGFPAVAAHTLIVGVTKDNHATGRKADVLLAAHFASEIALRLVKPGNEVWLAGYLFWTNLLPPSATCNIVYYWIQVL